MTQEELWERHAARLRQAILALRHAEPPEEHRLLAESVDRLAARLFARRTERQVLADALREGM